MSKRIVLTGGGTSGHVTPNLALLPHLQAMGWTVDYIGSRHGVEKDLLAVTNIPYHPIFCGKLRRYFSWQNFIDPFLMLFGVMQSFLILRRLKAKVVFSKGGFVSLPVVIGAYLNRIPVIIHESDMTPGLANRLSFPFAKLICLNFEQTKRAFKSNHKIRVTGSPIRDDLLQGNKTQGLKWCHFTADKPCLLVIGGSLGSAALNQCVRSALPELTTSYQVIHLCGKGKLDKQLSNTPYYHQQEYAHDELAHLYAASDVILSRAGANSVCELLALCKPHILVPLSRQVSRGDQVDNAAYFEKQGISMVIAEEDLNSTTLLNALDQLAITQQERVTKMTQLSMSSATQVILKLIAST